MYHEQDGGYLQLIGTFDEDDIMSEEDIINYGPPHIRIDPHVYPILMSLRRLGIETIYSCGGHYQPCVSFYTKEDEIDPMEIGVKISEEEARTLVQKITAMVNLTQLFYNTKSWNISPIALERIDVNPFYKSQKGTAELVFRTKKDNLDVDHRCDKYMTPEIIIEWNKVLMVMQVAAAIDLLVKEKEGDTKDLDQLKKYFNKED